MKRIVFICTLLVLAVLVNINTVKAQFKKDTLNIIYPIKAWGVNAGSTTGLGLSYYYIGAKRHGYQITLLPIVSSGDAYFSLGITYLRLIKMNNYTNFVFYVGNHIEKLFTNYQYPNDINYHLGLGPGVQIVGNNISLNGMVGYGLYNIPRHNTRTMLSGEIGVFYTFD